MKSRQQSIFAVIILTSMLTTGLSLATGEARAATNEVKLTYDPAGRLVTATYGNGMTISYVYDNNGNMIERKVTTPVVRRPRRHLDRTTTSSPIQPTSTGKELEKKKEGAQPPAPKPPVQTSSSGQ